MTDRQQIAFVNRNGGRIRAENAKLRKGSSIFVTSLWVKKVPRGYFWVATVGREASNGTIEPLQRVPKEDKELMVAIGCDLLHGVGDGLRYAVRPLGNVVLSFMKVFSDEELRRAEAAERFST